MQACDAAIMSRDEHSLSKSCTAAAQNTSPGQISPQATLRRHPAGTHDDKHNTSTSDRPVAQSSSCTVTVVPTNHANPVLLQPFSFFTDILGGWRLLNIASSIVWRHAFPDMRCETQTPSSLHCLPWRREHSGTVPSRQPGTGTAWQPKALIP